MSFIIAIPSLKRSNVLKTKTLAFLKENNIPEEIIYVFIIEEEEELYQNELQDFNGHIIIGKKGLPAQRNFIQQYFDNNTNIFCLDDDVESWSSASVLLKDYTLVEFVDFAFQHCRKTKSFIWSTCPVHSDFYAKDKEETTHSLRYCTGAFYGTISRQDFLLDFTESEKEDVKRSLLYYINDGTVLRLSHTMFKTKYYGSVGGMGSLDSRLESSKSEVLSLTDQYNEYGYKLIKKTGTWDFRFKKKSCQTENCFCRRQVTVLDDLVVDLPLIPTPSIETEPPILKEKNDNSVQFFDETSSSEFSYLLELLSKVKVKKAGHRRGFPPHRAGVYGYTSYRVPRKKGVLSGTSADSIKYPEIYQELLRLGTTVSPDYDFSATHVNVV